MRLPRGEHPAFAFGLLLGALALAAPLGSQERATPQRPSLRALAVTEPITVDGVLDDAAWARAEKGSSFVQREPSEREAATEPTEVQVAYTSRTLYVAVHCFDSAPGAIVAKEMRRDRSLAGDDSLVILIDTFRDRRNAYFFEINPNGAQRDSIVTDEGRDVNLSWDGIWKGAARRVANGWVAEIAIPFSTLLFDPDLDTWGFNVRRIIRRKNEEVYWSPVLLDANVRRVSLAGSLTGLAAPKPGLDLQVKPFVAGSTESDRRTPSRSGDAGDLGLDLKWGLARTLTLNGTVNTDFAETEVDALQINLTRFSLFFPEKREFFLENAGIFDFGPGASAFGPPLLRIFHSRRIGIGPGGEQVPIEWGGRLTGRVSDWSLGVLHVTTEETGLQNRPITVPSNRWDVLRFKRNLGQRSRLGLILTSRDAGGDDSNRVLGFDANINPRQELNLNAFYSASDTPGNSGDVDAWGFGAGWSGSRLLASFDFLEIGEDYNPEVGFLLRRNVRRYSPDIHYLPRPDIRGVRHLDFQVLGEMITDLDGRLETVSASATLFGVRLRSDDFLSLFYDWNFEQLDAPFEIVPGVVIPPGEYRFPALGTFFASSNGRRISVDGFLRYGEFFDGDRYDHQIRVVVRPSRFFGTETTWSYNRIDLPAGAFSTSLVQTRFTVSLRPTISADTFLQFNDLADRLAMNVRFRWNYRPGADLFVVYNTNWEAPTLGALATLDSRLTVKLTYLLEW